jgi:hypothetical protein
MATTPYDLSFLKERTNEVVCRKRLSREETAKFRDVRPGWGGSGARPSSVAPPARAAALC